MLLSAQEQVFGWDSTLGYRNTGFVFVVKHAVENVRDALCAVQRRHPVLRCRVSEDGTQLVDCCSEVDHHIILQTEERPELDDLLLISACKDRLEQVVNTPLRDGRLLAMWRLGGRNFVVVFSHVLFDGFSRLLFVNDFLAAAASASLSTPQPAAGSAVHVLRLLEPNAVQEDDQPPPAEAFAPIPPPAPVNEGAEQHVAIELIRVENIDSLLANCRRHRVTFTCALGTALARSAFPGKENVCVGLAVNVRKEANLPETELINAGMPAGVVVTRPDLTLWEAAAQFGERLNEELKTHKIGRSVLRGYVSRLEANKGKLWPESDVTKFEVPFILSNLGRCVVPDDVTCLFGAQGKGNGGCLQIHIHTIGSGCFISFSFLVPLYSREYMRGIVYGALKLVAQE